MTAILSTYRLQFGPHMDFARAAGLADHFARLGVTHLYASPVFAARSGSEHGYDVIDYNRISDRLGGVSGFEAMARALAARDIGVVLDIVPNHMAASAENPWFADMLAHGRASRRARVFDVDWDKEEGRIVLPVLGEPLDEALQAGLVSLDPDPAFGRAIVYYDKRFPLAPGTENGDLRAVLDRQHYRLSYWRDLDRLNYRRFFDITDLIGVRMEDEAVFDAAHGLIRDLVEKGLVHGLRVDHVDGLRDPKGYLDRLAAFFPGADPPPVWVEKILEADEILPGDWPVAGETGYAAMTRLDGVFVDPQAEETMTRVWLECGGDGAPFGEVAAKAKRETVRGAFAHEFQSLAERLSTRTGVSANRLSRALETLAVSFPAYRTYLRPGADNRGERDRLAAFAAVARADDEDEDAMNAVLAMLGDADEPVALDFQQMTGAVMAKAVEDTAFYRAVRFVALNEVGGDPARFGVAAAAFHAFMAARARAGPRAMTATSSHDAKRGEDVRARLAALTWAPDLWAAFARDMLAATTRLRAGVSDRDAYLLLQNAVGFWPAGSADVENAAERLAAYAIKAAREAKVETSWRDPDTEYEKRLEDFARGLCEGSNASRIGVLVEAIADDAAHIGVARAVLKATVPGVADIYQGAERADLSLVDPDNRREVDFKAAAAALDGAGEVYDARKAGVLAALLALRRRAPALFLKGDYAPLPGEEGTLAFRRRSGSQMLFVSAAVRPGAPLARDGEGDIVIDDPAVHVRCVAAVDAQAEQYTDQD